MSDGRRRIAWFAGSRSEVLRLGPLFRAFAAPGGRCDSVHWFVLTGEQGVPVFQSVDLLELHPDESFELRHPAEDPAVRLIGVMGEVEEFMRRRRVDTAVVTGYSPTALAAALVAAGRGREAAWVRPHDPLGLIPRMRWERGIEPLIRAAPGTRIIRAGAPGAACADEPDIAPPREAWIEGRRPGAPLALLYFGRGLWGIGGGFARIAAAAGELARAHPEADWVFLSALDARLEGELRSMTDRPANLLSAGPLPLPEYRAALAEARLIATDSFNCASEAMEAGTPLLAVSELPPAPETRAAPNSAAGAGPLLHTDAMGLGGAEAKAFLAAALAGPAPARSGGPASIWRRSECVRRALERAFEGAPPEPEAR